MYQKNNIISSLIVIIGMIIIGYFLLLFLPVILVIGALCALYAVFRFWQLQHEIKKSGYKFGFEEENTHYGRVIDAEYEILNEKKHK